MANGQATCTPGSLTRGRTRITTVYSGDSTYNGVTSSTLAADGGSGEAEHAELSRWEVP
jgi:hypothetical protein